MSGSRASSLPMPLVCGRPVDIDDMTLAELTSFLPFLIRCTTTTNGLAGVSRPIWWPSAHSYPLSPLRSGPLTAQEGKCKVIRSLIRECYEFFNQEYLIEVSRGLATNDRLVLRDDGNGMSSFLNGSTGGVCVTIRNENRDYDKENTATSDVISSSMPLPMARGKPTDLARMTLTQLQRFLPFLLKCIAVDSTVRPPWWIQSLDYPLPSLLPGTKEEQAKVLRRLIHLCYRHYDREVLLVVSQHLAENGHLVLRDLGNGSSSLVDLATGTFVVNFLNENRDYDADWRPSGADKTPERRILSRAHICNWCGERFRVSSTYKTHMMACSAKHYVPCQVQRPETPDNSDECIDQEMFLAKCGLVPATRAPPGKSQNSPVATFSRRDFNNVEMTSFLGQRMVRRSSLTVLDDDSRRCHVQQYSNYCSGGRNLRSGTSSSSPPDPINDRPRIRLNPRGSIPASAASLRIRALRKQLARRHRPLGIGLADRTNCGPAAVITRRHSDSDARLSTTKSFDKAQRGSLRRAPDEKGDLVGA